MILDLLMDVFFCLCSTLELLGAIGGFLFFVLLFWAVCSPAAARFLDWFRDNFL